MFSVAERHHFHYAEEHGLVFSYPAFWFFYRNGLTTAYPTMSKEWCIERGIRTLLKIQLYPIIVSSTTSVLCYEWHLRSK